MRRSRSDSFRPRRFAPARTPSNTKPATYMRYATNAFQLAKKNGHYAGTISRTRWVSDDGIKQIAAPERIARDVESTKVDDPRCDAVLLCCDHNSGGVAYETRVSKEEEKKVIECW